MTHRERNNRNARRDRIVAKLDASQLAAGRSVYGQDIVSLLRDAPEAWWAQVQEQLGETRRISEETRAEVVKVYAYRTEGDRLAREYLARMLGQVAA